MSVSVRRTLAGLIIGAACSLAVGAESPADLLAKADRLWAEGKLDQAQQGFEAAARLEPVSAATLLRLAGFQLGRQKVSESIATYQKAISLDPKNSAAWIGLGLAYLHRSAPELARAAFDEAIRVDPSRKEKLAPLLAKLDEKKS